MISQLPKLHRTLSLSLSWQLRVARIKKGQYRSTPILLYLALKPPIFTWLDSDLEETMNKSNI